MKIAFFFLLIGASCYFVTANSGIVIADNDNDDNFGSLASCTGKITDSQGRILLTLLILLIHKYEALKRDGLENTYKKTCLLEDAFLILRVLNSCLECGKFVVFNQVMDCLTLDSKSKDTVRKAFETDRAELALEINAEIGVLVQAVCCTVDKIIKAQKIIIDDMFHEIISSLNVYFGPLMTAVLQTTRIFLTILSSLATNFLNALLGGVLGGKGGPLGVVSNGIDKLLDGPLPV